jgi:hypothetical protein
METNVIEQKEVYFTALIGLKGTAPRCRKIEYHSIDLAKKVPLDLSLEQIDDLKKQANEVLLKYKNVSNATINLYYTIDEGGFTSMEIMGLRNIKIRL